MKLATFTHAGRTRIGLVDDSEIVDLSAAVPDLPQEMCAFLRAGRPALDFQVAYERNWSNVPASNYEVWHLGGALKLGWRF